MSSAAAAPTALPPPDDVEAAASAVRVLFLLNALHIGGAEKHTVTLLNGLDRRRFRPSARWLKDDVALLPDLDTSRLQSAGCLNVSRKLDWAAVNALTAQLDAEGIDVIVCANEYPALYAWLAAQRARRRPRLVEIFHTTEYASVKERLQMLLYKRVLSNFDLLVYVSEAQRQYWRAHGLRAAQDLTIHNGIDCERFSGTLDASTRRALRADCGFAADDYVIALCAALRPEKAHGDLLKALVMLRESLPQARALLIGDGPERPRIEALVRQLKLDSAVKITGFQRDVRPFIACSDVAVLTSHKIETFSIAALEAMSMGKPMVQTRIGGAAEQIQPGENGFLYEAGDIPALAGHLRTLANGALRQDLGACAALRVRERFGEKRMLECYATQLAALGATVQ